MSIAKGLFPDRGFHYKKGTKQTNKLACPLFLPPSLLSFRSIIAAAILDTPTKNKIVTKS